MRIPKMLGSLGTAALVVGMIPYRFKSDKENGSFEVGSLLWSVKKTPGEEGKDNYTIELLPFVKGNGKPAEAAEEAEITVGAADGAAEEPEMPTEEPEVSAEEPEVQENTAEQSEA